MMAGKTASSKCSPSLVVLVASWLEETWSSVSKVGFEHR